MLATVGTHQHLQRDIIHMEVVNIITTELHEIHLGNLVACCRLASDDYLMHTKVHNSTIPTS